MLSLKPKPEEGFYKLSVGGYHTQQLLFLRTLRLFVIGTCVGRAATLIIRISCLARTVDVQNLIKRKRVAAKKKKKQLQLIMRD